VILISSEVWRGKKPCILPRWSHISNSILEICELKEVKLVGRKYSWANNLPDSTLEKLDRVLVSSELDLAFPLAVFTGKNRDISKHVPLMLKNAGD
jgi:endonuclease/exonuclease/phosphatase family metal-dependent hydrolase